ncbi:hypothetical protein pipiens_020486, partial [Culex pipiens pipiens]
MVELKADTEKLEEHPDILRRIKKDIEKSLPAKVEQILRVEMTSSPRRAAQGQHIPQHCDRAENHALLTRPTEFETQTYQDEVVVQLLKGSGKLVLLDKLLCRLKETDHRLLIFSQMRLDALKKNQDDIHRLVTAKSVEEEFVERAKKKMVLDHLVIQRMNTTGRTLLDKNGDIKFGAEELFKEDEDGDDELVCDIDEIWKRAETRNEASEILLIAFFVANRQIVSGSRERTTQVQGHQRALLLAEPLLAVRGLQTVDQDLESVLQAQGRRAEVVADPTQCLSLAWSTDG